MAHYLIVTEPKPKYFEHDVEHEDCPRETHYDDGFLDGIEREWDDFVCPLGIYLDYWGLADLEDEPQY